METPHNASRKRPLLDAPETPAGGAGPVTPSSGMPRHPGASQAHELWSGAKTVANKAVGRALNLNSSSPSAAAAGSPYAHAIGGSDDQSPGAVRASRPPLQLDYDETASKAMRRRRERPAMRFGNMQLDQALKARGIQSQGIPMCVEISGVCGSGKTRALLHLVANTAMPAVFATQETDAVTVGGLSSGVVFFCMGCTPTQILRPLVAIMVELARAAWSSWTRDSTVAPETWVDDMVNESLARVHLVQCHSSLQLLCSVRNLPQLLSCSPSVSCIILESLSAFYHIDRVNHSRDNEASRKQDSETSAKLFDAAFALLEKTAVEHRLAVFGTRWMMHGRKNKKPEALGSDLGASKRWHKMVTHRVTLGFAQVGDGGLRRHWAQVGGSDGKVGAQFGVTPFRTG